MKYVLKINLLKNILIISSLIAIGLPLCVILFIFPSFYGLLTKNTEDEAISIARHLASDIIENQDMLSRDSLPNEILSYMQGSISDFGLMKLKIYSKSGETIFSTIPKDIGIINKNRYFYDIVAKGNVYTTVVKKGTKSLEDQIFTADVVETYIPIIKNDAFAGAFEIYYDITDRKERLDKLLFTSSVVLILLAIGLQGVIIIALVKAGNNIVQREQSEEALRKSEERTRATFNAISDAVFLHPLLQEGFETFVDVNDTACERYGYTREEFLALKAPDITKKTDAIAHSAREHRQKLLEAGRLIFETTHIAKSGEELPVEINSAIIELSGRPMILAIVRDITHRRRAEEALQESERQVRLLLDSTAEAIYGVDMDGTCTFANPACLKLLGYKNPDELIGKNMHNLIHHTRPDGSPYPEEECRVYQAFRRGEGSHVDDEVLWRTDGTSFPAEYRSHPIFHHDQTVGSVVTFLNITERKRAKEALRESEEKYSNLFHKSNDAIIIHDLEGKIIDSNNKVLEQFGWSKSEILALKVSDLHPSKEHEKSLWAFGKIVQDGFVSFEVDFIKKTGELFTGEVSSSFFEIGTKKVIQGIIRDVTDRKKLEAQLIQAQKMEAIGTLAGGIAHDFNNLLMGIQGRASLMLMDTATTHPYYEHLQEIEDYVKSAADLTKQLLGFARGGKYEVRSTDLNELIKNQNRMFGRTKKEITIRGIYEKNLWVAEVDQGQIEQVLLNLYVNAWQSMPGGGDLYIQTENITLDENYTKPFEVKPGKYVKISVTDTGVGMDETTRQRIFDPFFTTKEIGRGTGLGLATVYGIIKNHEGFINVYSEKGEGATFNIYLPASEKEVIEERELAKDVLKGTETVLLVDDENVIIYAVERFLKEMGYKTLIARSGKETVKIYKKNKDKIDMVILDMIMPDMGGGETYDRLKEINPDIKVLLSSGYSLNDRATKILERGCNGFIQKPYRSRELSQKIREILDKD